MIESLYGLALLACPVGMGLMMWMMMRGGRQQHGVNGSTQDSDLATLRAEVQQLRTARGDSATPAAEARDLGPRS